MPDDVRVVDLGAHELKDLPRPERTFQLEIDGMPSSFPPRRTGGAPTLVEGREKELTRAAAVALPTRLKRRPLPGGDWVDAAVGPQSVWAVSYPNQVWRIDPVTQKPTAVIHANGASGVALGAGAIWIANQLAGSVSRVDARTDRLVATIHVGNDPSALTVAGNRVWVTVSGPISD